MYYLVLSSRPVLQTREVCEASDNTGGDIFSSDKLQNELLFFQLKLFSENINKTKKDKHASL